MHPRSDQRRGLPSRHWPFPARPRSSAVAIALSRRAPVAPGPVRPPSSPGEQSPSPTTSQGFQQKLGRSWAPSIVLPVANASSAHHSVDLLVAFLAPLYRALMARSGIPVRPPSERFRVTRSGTNGESANTASQCRQCWSLEGLCNVAREVMPMSHVFSWRRQPTLANKHARHSPQASPDNGDLFAHGAGEFRPAEPT